MWKEWRSLLRFPGGRWRLLLTMVAPIAFFAFYGPAAGGAEWVERPDAIFIAVIVPLVVAMMVVPDSFAGERERRTLATLLASRLPDRSILLGKTAFGVLVAWGMGLATMAAALVLVNVLHGDGELLMLTPLLTVASLTISLLVAVLTVAVGVMVSQRSATVQQAQQLVAAILLIPPMLIGPVLFLVAESNPGGLRRFFEGLDAVTVFFAVVGILLVLDLALGWLAARRFRRDRLVAELPGPA
jgi:ABC-2 type transport system permease protein